MMKVLVLIGAAVLTCTASAYGMNLAGWMSPSPPPSQSACHPDEDPLSTEAAIRYRLNHNINWRCAMMIRD
jgi:hypothetical protein